MEIDAETRADLTPEPMQRPEPYGTRDRFRRAVVEDSGPSDRSLRTLLARGDGSIVVQFIHRALADG